MNFKPVKHHPESLSSAKKAGFDFYESVLHSPKLVLAPMVAGSELAWRILSRYYGAELCYTPMIHAALFSEPRNSKYRQEQFNLDAGEEGMHGLDRPLLAQFCANDPTTLLSATNLIVCPDGKNMLDVVDGFDLNLGCPQGIARKGKYGAYLMDHPDLIGRIVSHLHHHSPLPITVKYRCFDTANETNTYTEHLIQAGAQILTLHGRTREQKGQFTGLADWNKIRSAAEISHQHRIPIFGNGNILTSADVLSLLRETDADGVMTAEGNLYNPVIYARLNPKLMETYRSNLPQQFKDGFRAVDEAYEDPEELLGSPESLNDYPNCTKIASQYLMICRTLETRTSISAIKGHLYKIFRPVFDTKRYNDIREKLAQVSGYIKPSVNGVVDTESHTENGRKDRDRVRYHDVLDCFQDVVNMIRTRLQEDRDAGILDESQIDISVTRGECEEAPQYLQRIRIPFSRCQPYVRPVHATDPE